MTQDADYVAHAHRWRFWGDDPYVVCECGESRDAITGLIVRDGQFTTPQDREAALQQARRDVLNDGQVDG